MRASNKHCDLNQQHLTTNFAFTIRLAKQHFGVILFAKLAKTS